MVQYRQDNLNNFNFDGQDLTNSIFDRCNLHHCSFKNCVMTDVTFDRCNCIVCDFDGVNMAEINFINTNIIDEEPDFEPHHEEEIEGIEEEPEIPLEGEPEQGE